MENLLAFILIFYLVKLASQFDLSEDLECGPGQIYNTSASAYYPDYQSALTRDFVDEKGKKLRSLQEYLDGRSSYVTVAMDAGLGIAYGTPLCIPQLNIHYGRYINLEVRDTSPDIFGCGYACVEIAVRTEADSYDRILNKELLMVVIQFDEEE
ncbi:uncharacterized protein LOC103508984 isoform X1 [Diaphorina citri]|uniref:Uncharacterized protein LOC103508984 isoform X1 n=1 Tax=Diaphorina citri TaxID=121845 RepID=A0A1S4EB96_DIACI|nr:uncharacterized protein LOC103508984 isoform X1 [Diaphorina citri]